MSLCLEGGCHCGAVRFRVRTEQRNALDCNCSMCTQKGYLHLIVKKDAFELLQGEEALSTYRFGTKVAAHHFCRTCGVHPFYIPRSHPDGVDVNVRTLDEVVAEGLEAWSIEAFDGRNWEKNVASIQSSAS